ncbi:MAG: Isoquinoline 1-oxidoreductase subunit [Alphaproteobacteria bacterium]|nr:Isoquinoline 1-oxidoreductase subunit [Alphaproteobacteria bacterium]
MLLAAIAAVAAGATLFMADQPIAEVADGLAKPRDFGNVANERQRSIAIFKEMGKVLQHPRCVNCHPRSDRPNQGDDQRPHMPPVARGPDGLGMPAMRCTTCHGEKNFSFGGGRGSLPGAESWHLAPRSMAWEGRALGEICEQIKDPQRNGGKSLSELQRHNAEDGLVGWGWEPGDGRSAAPGSQELFGQLTAAWIESGAHCPQ